MTKPEFAQVEAEFLDYLRTVDPLVDEDAKYIRAHSKLQPETVGQLEMFNAGKKTGFRLGVHAAVCLINRKLPAPARKDRNSRGKVTGKGK